MPDLEKTIRRALRELAAKRARIEKAIGELERLEQERTHIVKAMADLEDALEHLGSSTPARKPRTQSRRSPVARTQKGKKTSRKKASKKKKAPQAQTWTPAKRRAMAARMRKIWATRRKKR